MTLYVCQIEENKLITHDGHYQLGCYNMSLEKFMDIVKVEYVETYWIPDIVTNRYKRMSYQKHLIHQGQFLK